VVTSFDREISERPEPSAAEVDLSTGLDACVVEGLHAEQGASKFTVGATPSSCSWSRSPTL
jgi:hypothetical protein